jgi:ATP-binding cassette subfamily F protein 3
LVMDEPTNHLDIKSKNVLKDALENFEGTLLLVSHDRDFLQGLTSSIYEFKDHRIKEYLGDIDYYLSERKVEDMRAVEKRDKQPTASKNTDDTTASQDNKQSYEDQKKVKSLSNRLSKVEKNINQLEKEIKAIDLELELNYDKTIAQDNFFDNYQAKKKKLTTYMQDWETIQLELEQFS